MKVGSNVKFDNKICAVIDTGIMPNGAKTVKLTNDDDIFWQLVESVTEVTSAGTPFEELTVYATNYAKGRDPDWDVSMGAYCLLSDAVKGENNISDAMLEDLKEVFPKEWDEAVEEEYCRQHDI